MAIKHILLDLDDTVLDFHRAERVALAETFAEHSIAASDEVMRIYSEINRSCWQGLERGELTRDEVLVGRFARLFAALGIEADPAALQRSYEYNLSFKAFFFEGSERLLERLFGKYKLYIASNGTAVVQDRRIEISGIARYFDGIFISQRIGADKPSREFFDKSISLMGEPPRSEIMIVGDSLSSDIGGGLAAGIHTCYFNPKGLADKSGIVPEYEICSLDELPELLETI